MSSDTGQSIDSYWTQLSDGQTLGPGSPSSGYTWQPATLMNVDGATNTAPAPASRMNYPQPGYGAAPALSNSSQPYAGRPNQRNGQSGDGSSVTAQISAYAAIARVNAPAILGPLKRYAETFAVSYPLTTFHIAAGVSIHVVQSIGLFPSPTVTLFHPSYALVPRLQLYRIPISFMVLGWSTFDVARRGWMMFDYGSKVEAKTGSSFEGFLNWGSLSPERRMKELYDWASTNTYLHLQLISAGTILATEIVLNLILPAGDPDAAKYDPTFFRPLSPQLELSTLFLWAFLEPSTTTVNVFGVFPVQPLYFPVIMSLTAGVQSWRHMVQGFAGAVVAAKVLNQRRPYTDEDVVTWIGNELQGWRRWWSEGESRQVRRGGRIVQLDPPNAQESHGRGGFLGSAASTVSQQHPTTASGGLQGLAPPESSGVSDWFTSMLPPASRRDPSGAPLSSGAGRRLAD
ncbi:hypothetical protein M427DRAFT_135675 [Gonapodya prolifera JEL478]|uniref:Derlin n=1 Tax=Gonapodya prolifera (strain JEL478) TaxID=1344416 RepID=A0A139ACN5_GONPJ|nr:hypothetical protein M427DRAFT_135675 [Gonapodya prolifera JEL478]|eukprot:KXS14537.1 hypothetical protein M427DRAFT_135675 [Gonapodya prolifera JEL478]